MPGSQGRGGRQVCVPNSRPGVTAPAPQPGSRVKEGVQWSLCVTDVKALSKVQPQNQEGPHTHDNPPGSHRTEQQGGGAMEGRPCREGADSAGPGGAGAEGPRQGLASALSSTCLGPKGLPVCPSGVCWMRRPPKRAPPAAPTPPFPSPHPAINSSAASAPCLLRGSRTPASLCAAGAALWPLCVLPPILLLMVPESPKSPWDGGHPPPPP